MGRHLHLEDSTVLQQLVGALVGGWEVFCKLANTGKTSNILMEI